jgi:hypothetical protein
MIDLSQEFHPQPKVYKAKKEPKPIKQIGKKGKLNLEANKEFKKTFEEIGITECEIKLDGCWKIIMGFAHGKKRIDLTPEELKKFAIGACNPCHHKIEYECEKYTGLTMEQFVKKTIEQRNYESSRIQKAG